MRIVALLGIRNEEAYLARCLQHLFEQGIETCVIDNQSFDGSREIVERFRDKGVFRVETLPYRGFFDLVAQCQIQERLSQEIDADWFIRVDADEIREAPTGWGSLKQGIERVDREGFNAINFDEFVFMPEPGLRPVDYVSELIRYYYFLPNIDQHIKAWKNLGVPVNLSETGGHRAAFEGRVVHPVNFILRHYIGLSIDYLQKKYSNRIFSAEEVSVRGWHGWRADFAKWRVVLPPAEKLKTYDNCIWDKSDPQSVHQFVVRAQNA